MTTLTMILPSPLPLHANQRLHYRQRNERVATVREHARAVAARSGALRLPTPTHCVVTIGWPDRRRRDAHNAYPTVKAALDGIVLAGWLPDDSDEHLIGPDLRSSLIGHKGRVELTFTFTALPTPTTEETRA